jgi:hypothetical protein
MVRETRSGAGPTLSDAFPIPIRKDLAWGITLVNSDATALEHF